MDIKRMILKFNNIIDMKYFYDIYLFILSLITILGFIFNSYISISLILISMLMVLIIKNDMKYIIPNLLFIIFNINNGFKVDKIPLFFIFVVILIIVTLLIYTIKNRANFKKMKSIIGLLGLAIIEIIPICWNNTINESNYNLYFLYFADACYLALYVFLVNGIKSESRKYLAKSFSYLIIIIFFECLIKVIELKDTVDNVFTLGYFLGWGVCNEAVIMILVALPFPFYLIIKEKNYELIVIYILSIALGISGIILTFSRAGYIFLPIELTILLIISIYHNYKRKYFGYFLSTILILLLLYLIIGFDSVEYFIYNVINVIFKDGLRSNGRIELYQSAMIQFKSSWFTMLFGSGIVSEVGALATAYGIQDNAVIIYHSTFYETLVIGGFVGLLFLLILIKDKYTSLFHSNSKILYYLLPSYIIVDIYGLFDNTYHMYYYMIALCIIMACVDSDNYISIKKKDYNCYF